MNAANALAERGHNVELCVQGSGAAEAVLHAYGLVRAQGLRLRVLSPSNTIASVQYRRAFATWLLRRRHRPGVALARNRRHADWAQRWGGGRVRVILEAHGVGTDRALEARVLAGCWGLIGNCGGTLRQLREAHGGLPPAAAIHNAARPGPAPRGPGQGIGYVGSVRPYKDPQTLARAAAITTERVVMVGPDEAEVGPLRPLAQGRLVREPPLAPRDVPARLARFRALVLPLSPGPFGDWLTSPLKLWDALQSGVPLVAADTRAIREAAGSAFVPYRPGDAADLAAALDRACTDEDLRGRVLDAAGRRARTWAQRAAEVEAFADRVLG